jgi:16S rRNA (guanine527-N7)-methyltransferase
MVAAGGSLLALKGDRADAELADAQDVLRRLGATSAAVEEVGAPLVSPPVRMVRVTVGAR